MLSQSCRRNLLVRAVQCRAPAEPLLSGAIATGSGRPASARPRHRPHPGWLGRLTMNFAMGFESGTAYDGDEAPGAVTGGTRQAARRTPAFIAGASLEDGSVAISLTCPMRLLPPKSFHAPARAPLRSPTVVTDDAVINALFDRLKMKTR